ncbi:MAG: ABC transporter substrate-binding protein [Pseudomonadota bacterium]
MTFMQPRSIYAAVLVTCAMTILMAGVQSASARSEDPAVRFMRQATNALLNAQRRGSAGAFSNAIRTYGHYKDIALRALGDYRRALPRKSRPTYYKGAVRFIARYAATEAPKYPVARVKFPPVAQRDGRYVLVDSKVILRDGTEYDVQWRLLQNRRTFKVIDAKVFVFGIDTNWVSTYLTKLFQDYIQENGGKVGALVTVLSRLP